MLRFFVNIQIFISLFLSVDLVLSQDVMSDRPMLGRGLARGLDHRFGVDYIFPEMHKWYASRHLFESYMQPWYMRDTNYATGNYRRYVEQLLEGSQWYDGFGTALGRGWLVYSWTQTQPVAQGSKIMKRPANPDRRDSYSSFFSRLIIASDGDGRGTYRLMIGDQINTLFTPLTFYKPRFNGMRMDYSTDRINSTLLLSRPSEPNRDARTDVTNMMGGHIQYSASDYLRFGVTYVNAHNARTKEKFASGNPFAGVLTTRQNQGLQDLWINVRDDSPSLGEQGVALLAYDIVFTDTSGTQFRGSEIEFLPFVEGGRSEGKTLVASDSEEIVLHYDMRRLDAVGRSSTDIKRAIVELSIANDYRIEMASDLQTNGARRRPEPVFLTAERALGNVNDRSNAKVLEIDYTLPTGNTLMGINWHLSPWLGFSTKGEFVKNMRYGQYPSPNLARGQETIKTATASYVVASYSRYPWSVFVEGFSMDESYNSNYWLTDSSGMIRYKDEVPQLYEFVDDDDDSNAVPDWERPFQPWNNQVWPGYDENGDFLYDHNQNNNLQPDYSEPFLRYRSDRPEFLFGIDMNNNGTIDRFEDDDMPDYPYGRDLRGYNAYVQSNIGPDVAFFLGRQNMYRLSGDGITKSWYVLLSWKYDSPWGVFRIFDIGKSVRDSIPNHINYWAQPIGSMGRMRKRADELPATNTWHNTFYADWKHNLWSGTHFLHRIKWSYWWQRDSYLEVNERGGRARSGFWGVVNKGEWSIPIGLAVLEPRVKNEFRYRRPYSLFRVKSIISEQTLFILWTQPLMAESVGLAYFPRYGRQLFNTQLQVGLELSRLNLLSGRDEEVMESSRGWTWVGQITNRVGYLGYNLVLRTGLRIGNRHFNSGDNQRTSLFFLTVNAGL